MTTEARKVLSDSREALEEIQDGVQGSTWRIKWVAVITLLRTVMHTLVKVDSVRSTALQKVIKDKWEELNREKHRDPDLIESEPNIFWQFIEDERNSVIKLYEFNAGQGVTIKFGRGTEYHYTMVSGPYKDREQRELVAEAIQWLESYLDDVDRLAKGTDNKQT